MNERLGLTLFIEVKVVLVDDVKKCLPAERRSIEHHFTFVVKAFDELGTHITHTIAHVVVAVVVLRNQVHTVCRQLVHTIYSNRLSHHAFTIPFKSGLFAIRFDCVALNFLLYSELEDFGALSIQTYNFYVVTRKNHRFKLKIWLKANHDPEGARLNAKEDGVLSERDYDVSRTVFDVHSHLVCVQDEQYRV